MSPITDPIIKVLKSPLIMISVAIVLGLMIGEMPVSTEVIALGALLVIMTFSTTEIELRSLLEVRVKGHDYLRCLAIHYGFLSPLILLSAFLLVGHPALRAGFIVMAAIPPAIAVIPFAVLLRGDTELTTGALTVQYILSLALAPAIVWLLVRGTVDLWELIETLVVLICLPLLLSRLLRRSHIDQKLGSAREVIIVLGFFVLILTLIGAARNSAIAMANWLLPISIVLLVRTLVAGLVVGVIARKRGVATERLVPYMLFASFKNGGLTAVVAYALFGTLAALPAVLTPFFEFAAFITFQQLVERGWLGRTTRPELETRS